MIAGDIHDEKIITGNGAQTDGIGRVAVAHPMPAIAGVMQEAKIFRKETAEPCEIVLSELLTIANGQLEGGALEVAEKYLEVVGIDVRLFWRRSEKVIGVLDNVLIERSAGGNQHGDGGRLPAPGSPGSLPGGSDVAGISGKNNRIERTDVYTQFQRIGCHDRADIAGAQALLGMTPLLWQVTAAISADTFI
jgi:hypothetical protein